MIEPSPGEQRREPIVLDVYGLGCGVIGTALVFVSYCALPWFSGVDSTQFLDVHDVVDALGDAAGPVASVYFGWLGWILLGLCAVCVGAAVLPRRSFAVAQAGLGLPAAIPTVAAVKVFDRSGFGDSLDDARIGFYAALAGYVLVAAGGVLGLVRPSGTRKGTFGAAMVPDTRSSG